MPEIEAVGDACSWSAGLAFLPARTRGSAFREHRRISISWTCAGLDTVLAEAFFRKAEAGSLAH